jgi:hypothetical protein
MPFELMRTALCGVSGVSALIAVIGRCDVRAMHANRTRIARESHANRMLG